MSYRELTYWRPVCDDCGLEYVEEPWDDEPPNRAWPSPQAALETARAGGWQTDGETVHCTWHWHPRCAGCGRTGPVCSLGSLEEAGWNVGYDGLMWCPDCLEED